MFRKTKSGGIFLTIGRDPDDEGFVQALEVYSEHQRFYAGDDGFRFDPVLVNQRDLDAPLTDSELGSLAGELSQRLRAADAAFQLARSMNVINNVRDQLRSRE